VKKEKYNITGMTCSACSSHVEKAVKKLQGTTNVNVNLLSNNMVVEYDENKVNNNQIINAVVEAGYGAEISNNTETTAPKTSKEKKTNNNENLISSMKKRLIISICFLIPLMYIAMGHMINKELELPLINHETQNAVAFAFTQLLLLLPIVYVNRNYFIIGFKRLFKGTPNMDSLIAIGSSASIIYGIYAIYMIGFGLGHGDLELVDRFRMDLYFESAGTILTLITVGKYLETKSKGKTGDAISKLINLAHKTAILIKDEKEVELPVEEIQKGDIILIKPGYSIPVDGIIIDGNSNIDESSITGESMPVSKNIEDTVISGTLNKNGSFKMKATKIGDDTTLSQIIKLVEEAGSSKAPISRLADKVSGVFVPIVISIAVLATIFWLIQGYSIEFSLSIGIAVLVISCQCALGLATPLAIMVGTGKGAENGILIKSAESLELLHSVKTVVLDKTGTITEGKPAVTNIKSNIDENELIKIVASLEQFSEHPLAEAIMKKSKELDINLVDVKEFEAVTGRGVKGKIEDKNYFCGNLNFMKENNIDINFFEDDVKELLQQGKTVLYLGDTKLLGIIAVADTIKKSSYMAIKELKKNNLEVIMVTGDNEIVSNSIGKQLNIDKVISEVLPQDKEKQVKLLQENGKKVAFVGDGINDSPALTRADVGIAIGSGTDIAIESADVVLIKDNLMDAVNAIKLSKATIRNIKLSLFWAFIYNIIGIPVAAGVFYLGFGLKLNPMIGATAMSLSSVCVCLNALRLRGFKVSKIISENIEQETKISKVQGKDFTKIDYNKEKENKTMNKIISIEGMQCNHCKMTVEKALSNIDGVNKVEVSLEEKRAVIETSKEVSDVDIKSVIEEAGFEVKNIE